MSLKYQNILSVRVTTSPRETILEEIKKYLIRGSPTKQASKAKNRKPLVITTPNPEQIVYAHTHQSFRDILNKADVTLPDGIGIVLASRFLGNSARVARQTTVQNRIPGVEFMTDIARLADQEGVRIGLIGGFDGLAVRALECLQVESPKLKGWAIDGPELVVGAHGEMEGPPASYWKDLAEKIRSTKTGIIFVGLGAPKQEYVIEKLCSLFTQIKLEFKVYGKKNEKSVTNLFTTNGPLVFMAVGGSFDILTGRLKRAPLVIRSIGFEWAWRLANEPWRIQRQMALITFVWLVLKENFFSHFRQRD